MENQAILYQADIDNELTVDLSKPLICDRHFTQLFVKFDPKKYEQCFTCTTMSGLIPPGTKRLRQISRKYALRIHANFNLKYSYGELICAACRKGFDDYSNAYLSKRVSDFIERRNNQQRATTDAPTMDECDNGTKDISSEEDAYSDTDEDFVLGTDKESTQVTCEALNRLLGLCGNKNRTWMTHNYRELVRRTRLNYLLRVRSIIKSVISITAPNDFNQLEHDLFEHQGDMDVVKLDGHFLSVMEGVSEA